MAPSPVLAERSSSGIHLLRALGCYKKVRRQGYFLLFSKYFRKPCLEFWVGTELRFGI